jgi:hypothetical protein
MILCQHREQQMCRLFFIPQADEAYGHCRRDKVYRFVQAQLLLAVDLVD